MKHQSKLKRYVTNLKNSDLQALVGVTVAVIGLSLWIDRHYFFWPPSLQNQLNDEGLDVLFICIGLSLFLVTMAGSTNKTITRWLLVACATIAAVLFAAQVCHGFFAGEPRMAHTAIGDALLFLLILHVSHDA
jgi:hypothetical protein